MTQIRHMLLAIRPATLGSKIRPFKKVLSLLTAATWIVSSAWWRSESKQDTRQLLIEFSSEVMCVSELATSWRI